MPILLGGVAPIDGATPGSPLDLTMTVRPAPHPCLRGAYVGLVGVHVDVHRVAPYPRLSLNSSPRSWARAVEFRFGEGLIASARTLTDDTTLRAATGRW